MAEGRERRRREEKKIKKKKKRREKKEVSLGQEICYIPRQSRRWAPEEYTEFAFADLNV